MSTTICTLPDADASDRRCGRPRLICSHPSSLCHDALSQLRDASVVFRWSTEQPILPTRVWQEGEEEERERAKGSTDKQP
jgi:hypothetical protein